MPEPAWCKGLQRLYDSFIVRADRCLDTGEGHNVAVTLKRG